MSLFKLKYILTSIFLLILVLSPVMFKGYEYIDTISKRKFEIIDIVDEPLNPTLKIVDDSKQIAIDISSVAAIKDDGTLWTWGFNEGYLRSDENKKSRIDDTIPYQIEGIDDAVAVVTGGLGVFALLKADGTVWAWGRVGSTDVIVDSDDDSYIIKDLRQIKGIKNVVDIAIDDDNLAFLTQQGDVYIMGNNTAGWVSGDLTQDILKTPTKVPNLKNIVRIEISGKLLLALNKKGELYSTGVSTYRLGRITNALKNPNSDFHIANKIILPKKVVDFVASIRTPMALLEDGSVWIWGRQKNLTMRETTLKGLYIDLNNEFTEGNVSNGLVDEALLPVKHELLHKVINIGENQAVTENGNLYVWGTYKNTTETKSEYESDTTHFRNPRLIKKKVNPQQLYYSRYVSVAIMKNGSVYFWHSNMSGARGTGEIVQGDMTDDYIFTPEKSLFTTN